MGISSNTFKLCAIESMNISRLSEVHIQGTESWSLCNLELKPFKCEQETNTWDKSTFVTRTNSEFASQLVPHKSTNTIWSTGRLANSEFVLVANLLLSHV